MACNWPAVAGHTDAVWAKWPGLLLFSSYAWYAFRDRLGYRIGAMSNRPSGSAARRICDDLMRHLSVSSPALYRITLKGGLDETWSTTLGMKVSTTRDSDQHPVTTLTGEVIDQAMLLGVLNYVYDLGMPIMLVEWLDA